MSRFLHWLIVGLVAMNAWLFRIQGAIADSLDGVDLFSEAPIVDVRVSLGNRTNDLIFEPDDFTFVAGKRYRLILKNPSAVKHYFTSKDFADSIWTQKVEAGKVEVKGAIHEVELKPQAVAEWVFVPIKPGSYELHCAIPGHAQAGMVGQLQVVSSSKSSANS